MYFTCILRVKMPYCTHLRMCTVQLGDKRTKIYAKNAHTQNASKKTRMRVNTYAKRLISIYELSFCLSFVTLSLFCLNRLRCGECENNLRVLWLLRKKISSYAYSNAAMSFWLDICVSKPKKKKLIKFPFGQI